MEILTRPANTADARIAYGADSQQFCDLRVPAGAGPHPVVIGIHGGYWRAQYGLEYYGHLCEALRAEGIATWNIEYRRIGNGGGWTQTFLDAAKAVDHLRVIASQYNLDLSHVVALGHSAGGHLGCWLAGRHHIPRGDDLWTENPLRLKGVVSLAGVLDLRRGWELRLSSNIIESFLGGTPTDFPARYDTASPIELLPLGVPQVLIHGAADVNVPHEISQRYFERAQTRGDTVELVTLPEAEHFRIVDPATEEWQVVLDAVRRLLQR